MYIESEVVELKEKYTDAIVRDLVAFLNTEGGKLYLGITDNSEIIGIPFNELDGIQKKISDCITTQIEPNPQSEIYTELIEEDNKKILAVTINRGYKSIYCIKKYGYSSKGCLIRIGTTCKEMSTDEISYRYQLGMIEGDNILKAPSRYSPLSFDMMKILLTSKGFHINQSSFESNFNLRRNDGNYNLMAEILSDQNMIPLIFVKFNGNTKASIAQRNDYGEQSILLGYQRLKDRLIAENICQTNTTVRPRIDDYLYDMDCVNEALVNALVHNDWLISEPLISFFNDRLEITSHGGLPRELTKEEFFKGISHPRNSVLMRIFLKLGIVEHTGHGVPRVIKKYGEKAFDIHDSFINVIIPFNKNITLKKQFIGEDNVESISDLELTNNESRVLLELMNNPNMTYSDIVLALNSSRRTISRVFNTLVDKGYIERVGTNKSGYWKIIK